MKKKLILLCVLALLVTALAVNANAASVTATLTPSVSTVATGQGSEDASAREITLTLSLTGYTGTLTGWSSVGLRYDNTAFEYVAGSLTKADRLGTVSFTNPVNQNGTFTIGASMTDVPDAGDMLTLKFRALNSATTGDYSFQILNVNVTTANGDTFDIKNPASVTVNHTHETAPTGNYETNPSRWTLSKNEESQDMAPTCLAEGQEQYTCTYCNKAVTRAIDQLEHQMTKNDGTSVTCLTNGAKDTYTCSLCTKTYILDGEDYVEAITSGDDDNVTIKATGHVYVKHEEDPATCTKDGEAAHYTCENCTLVFPGTQDITDKFAESSMTAEALKQGYEKIGHANAEYKGSQKPTVVDGEVQEGWKDHWYCPDCGGYFKVNPTGKTDEEIGADNIYGYDTEENPKAGRDEVYYVKVSGDANGDNTVDGQDATIILRYIANLETQKLNDEYGLGLDLPYDTLCDPNLINSDVNNDNVVDGQDTTIILRYIANQETQKLNDEYSLGLDLPYDTLCTLQ